MGKAKQAAIIWALGSTQVVGYGTMYYSFSILADDVVSSFSQTRSWFFMMVSIALVVGGLIMPFAGRLFDHFGAARLMSLGSMLGGICLALTAATTNVWAFAIAMAFIQLVSSLVLYDAAFTSIVQSGIGVSQQRIMVLTLIAGFASSLFWPLTSSLDAALGWRATLFIYAGLNVFWCLPIHLWLAKTSGKPVSRKSQVAPAITPQIDDQQLTKATSLRLMVLITAGFSLTGVALSAILSQMVPLLQSLGLGAGAALGVSTLFGPAQVAIRAINLFFGETRDPLKVTIFALALLPLALLILAATAPLLVGAVVFAIMVGLSSGLKSIVQGTLPLAVFGRAGYGARLGIMSGARYVLAALAPFSFAWISQTTNPKTASVIFATIGFIGVLCFIEIMRLGRRGDFTLKS